MLKREGEMEKDRIGVWGRMSMRGLRNQGLIEVSQDSKQANYVLIMSKGIQRKWLMFNFPEEMWRVRCTKEEVIPVIDDFLKEKVMAG